MTDEQREFWFRVLRFVGGLAFAFYGLIEKDNTAIFMGFTLAGVELGDMGTKKLTKPQNPALK